MAHKTLIDGTAYKISGGKTLIGGTAYKIDGGRTLIGGTAYEVVFATIISFTVRGRYTYYAEEGMTWAEFIESDYNPSYDGLPFKYFEISGTNVKFNEGGLVDAVKITDLIISGYDYDID